MINHQQEETGQMYCRNCQELFEQIFEHTALMTDVLAVNDQVLHTIPQNCPVGK